MNKSVRSHNMSAQDQSNRKAIGLPSASGSKWMELLNVRFSDRGIATPEADWQANHEESMRAKIGGNGKVTIESRSAQFLLHPS